jgi:hypothetical protein
MLSHSIEIPCRNPHNHAREGRGGIRESAVGNNPAGGRCHRWDPSPKINPFLQNLRMDSVDGGAAGAVAGATSADKKARKIGPRRP